MSPEHPQQHDTSVDPTSRIAEPEAHLSRIVSDATQKLFMQLVGWECFGSEIDPKKLLRQVPIEDLKIVSANIKAQGSHMKNFACVSMVELELLFKLGMLQQDWSFSRKDDQVSLQYEPVSFPTQKIETRTTDLFIDSTPVGAMA